MQDAINELKSDAALEQAERDITIDKDTQGVSGSPPIMETIFAKIDAATAFLADLTFVGKRADGRLMPNPNVTLEYGWALKSLGNRRIIGVMNVAHGNPAKFDLPFDLGHLRRPIQFDCPSDADETVRREQRKQLVARFKETLKAVLALPGPPGPASLDYMPLQPKDGQARFRAKGKPIGIRQIQRSFGSREFEEPQYTNVVDGPAMWLRVTPTKPIGKTFSLNELENAMNPDGQGVFPINAPDGSLNLWRAKSFDGYALCVGIAKQTPISAVQAFTCGEVWSLDTFYLSEAAPALLLDEPKFVEALTHFAGVLRRLGVPAPYRWIAGVEGAEGRVLVSENSGRKIDGNHHCVSALIEKRGAFSGEAPEAAKALEPFFAAIFEMCGVPR